MTDCQCNSVHSGSTLAEAIAMACTAMESTDATEVEVVDGEVRVRIERTRPQAEWRPPSSGERPDTSTPGIPKVIHYDGAHELWMDDHAWPGGYW